MKKRKRNIHLHLPLKVPQNIIDIFIEYREWRKDNKAFPRNHKDMMLKRLSTACKAWHLYSFWESMAGSFWIHTKVGVVVYVHVNEEKPLTIHQSNNFGHDYNAWQNKYPMEKQSVISDKQYVYHWENYTPLVPE